MNNDAEARKTSEGMTGRQLAQLVDISAVQASNTEQDVRELVGYAKRFGFKAVHTLPTWTSLVAELLLDRPDILTGAPAGFPSGGSVLDTKVGEAQRLLRDGVDELDLMISVGRLRTGHVEYVEQEVRSVVQVAGSIPVKVILEVAYLSEDEVKRGCECAIYGGAAFVKTGTGWADRPSTIAMVRTIRDFVGDAIRVKAAGGIRTVETIREMLQIGVSRFGINTAVAVDLVEELSGQGET